MEDNTPSTDSTRLSDSDNPPPSITETGKISVARASNRTLPSNTTPSGNSFSAMPAGRIEANTALLKIGAVIPGEQDFETGTPPPDDDAMLPDEDEGGEAASARIAQEYRRQVRIKRLAEEIQTAEREKKQEENNRRKSEFAQRQSNSFKKTATTAKVSAVEPGSAPVADSQHAQKRAAAMSAFRQASVGGSAIGKNLLIAAACILFLLALGGGGWWGFNRFAASTPLKEPAVDTAALAQAQAAAAKEAKAAQELKAIEARELEVLHQRQATEEAAKKLEEQKRLFEEQQRTKEAERLKAIEVEAARRVAEVEEQRKADAKRLETARREKEELDKLIEEKQRLARENLKKKQDEEAAQAAIAAAKAQEAVEPVKPLASKPDAAKADAPKPDAPKTDLVKTEIAKTEVAKTETPKPAAPLTGDVKTIPSESSAIPDRVELPSGGVRLYVKASDPYGGKLLFSWRQLKGKDVEIADPTAAKFVDGKWISQTYFIAREPGGYEFEVVVKNDEGVETRKKFPIEVLPPTTLK